MSSIVTDTHALLWYLLEPKKLSSDAHKAMAEAGTNGTIYVPAVVLVELRYLVEKGKIIEDVFRFVADSIADSNSSLEIAALDFDTATAVGNIPRASVPDMPDRIIAATALEMGLPLVTRDRKITASNLHVIW